MEYTALFAPIDKTKFAITQLFLNQQSALLTTEHLVDLFELTKYQLSTIYDNLNDDLWNASGDLHATIDDSQKGVWRVKNVTSQVLQNLGIMYFERSPLRPVFEYRYLYSEVMSKADYISQIGTATSSFYKDEKKLNHILTEEHFEEDAYTIADKEHTIRLHLFQFYYSIFNGTDESLGELDEPIERLVHDITSYYHVQLKPTQSDKLRVFLYIWIMRTKNDHHVYRAPIETDSHINDINCLDDCIHEDLVGIIKPSQADTTYLYSFLIIQNLLSQQPITLAPRVKQPANKFTDQLINTVKLLALIDEHYDLAALRESILAINVQLMTFYIEPVTFIDNDQISFFQELYPTFDVIISAFIQQLQNHLQQRLTANIATNLYYSYMFAFINHIPANQLKDQITVCVDFSYGNLYSEYVTSNLVTFNNAHLVVTNNLNDDFDLYLSDFYSNDVTVPEVVWQNPPTPTDWSELADLVITLKQNKVAALFHDHPDINTGEV